MLVHGVDSEIQMLILFVFFLCIYQGSVHSVAGVLYYYGILSVRAATKYSER